MARPMELRIKPLTPVFGADLSGFYARAPLPLSIRAGILAVFDEWTAVATQHAFTYRHVWRNDDLVMWDNRAVLHRGHPYDEIRERWLLVRTTLAGDGPTATDDGVIAQEGVNA
jgi:hypothetical protein